MKYGYARISTDDQKPRPATHGAEEAGCQTVFKDERLSGATTKRPALLRCLKKLEHGDTLIVWKLDRLGRSLRDLITMTPNSSISSPTLTRFGPIDIREDRIGLESISSPHPEKTRPRDR